jgi:hypothetical protein
VFLDSTVQNPNEHVQWCVDGLGLNPNEVGASDCEDGKMRTVLVQATMHGKIRHDTSWNISDCQADVGDHLDLPR